MQGSAPNRHRVKIGAVYRGWADPTSSSYVYSLPYSSQQPFEKGTSVFFILQMRKLMPRKVQGKKELRNLSRVFQLLHGRAKI